jgi:two-component system chemotaxis response regulator CheB
LNCGKKGGRSFTRASEPMAVIRTLIVDDSAFVRKVVREMLSSSPEIEVVGQARNGEEALRMVEELKPDVVTCDLLMPELDGVGFVRRQMARQPVPILVLSASAQDAEQVLEALDAGAVDFVQKPTALANHKLLSIREELVQHVKAAALAPSRPSLLPSPELAAVPSQPCRTATNVDVVVLGISTGGPQALRYLLPQFPAGLPVPLVIVLHMPIGYTAIFAEKLNEISKFPIKEAFAGCAVTPGQAWLAPAGRHLSFNRTAAGSVVVQLSVEPLDKPHRPSVDVLFQSAAEVYGRRVLGVVMTGMGDDGLQGAAWIKAQGGRILTESEASCVIYGMPRSVVEAGLSDAAVPLTRMAEEICKQL